MMISRLLLRFSARVDWLFSLNVRGRGDSHGDLHRSREFYRSRRPSNQTNYREGQRVGECRREPGNQNQGYLLDHGRFRCGFFADAADDETMTAFAASMGSLGNIRTQTMRAFSAQEMNQILAKLPA